MKKPLIERNGELCELQTERNILTRKGTPTTERRIVGQVKYEYLPTDTINRLGNAVRTLNNEDREIYVFKYDSIEDNKQYTKSHNAVLALNLTAENVLADNICSLLNELILDTNVVLKEAFVENNKFKIKYLYKGKERISTQPLT